MFTTVGDKIIDSRSQFCPIGIDVVVLDLGSYCDSLLITTKFIWTVTPTYDIEDQELN